MWPQIDLGNERQLPLLRLRGQVRPVILCGSRAFVETAIREADPYYQSLRERGVAGVRALISHEDLLAATLMVMRSSIACVLLCKLMACTTVLQPIPHLMDQ